MTELSDYTQVFDQSGRPDLGTLVQTVRGLQNANSGGAASSLIVKRDIGLLFGFTVYNSNAAAQFILVFDQLTVPSNGAVPLIPFPVAGVSILPVLWMPPRSFRNGIVLVNSSTSTTLTIGSADCIFDAQYV